MTNKKTIKQSSTTPSLRKHQHTLWTNAQHHYDKAIHYNQTGEWIAGYYNMQLSALACKQYISACGLVRKDDGLVREDDGLVHTLQDPPQLDRNLPYETLQALYTLFSLYQKKVRTFQRAFGCPRSTSSTPFTSGSTADTMLSTTDCSDLPNVDLTSDAVKEVYFSDLIGNDLAKEAIEDGVLYPILMPSLYPNQANAILFYGPPGTGKTLLARATAFELNKRSDALQVLFFAPTADQFKGKFVGQTEEKIVKLFACASQKATEHQALMRTQGHKNIQVKSILFIDEIDSLARRRDKQSGTSAGIVASATNTLLQTMDGVQSYDNVIVMAATNYPWSIDTAVLRRFDQKVYVDLPNEEDTAQLLQQSIVKHIAKSLQFDTTNKQHQKSLTEQFLRLQSLHGLQRNELNVLAAELVGGFKDVGYSPRDILRVCDNVYKTCANQAMQEGIFYCVQLIPERAKHNDHLQMFDDILEPLEGKYVSQTTFDALKVHMLHAFNTHVRPTHYHNASFPHTIRIIREKETLAYQEYNTLSRTDNIPRLDNHVQSLVRVYIQVHQLSNYTLHRSFHIYARNQKHHIPVFALGTWNTPSMSSESLLALGDLMTSVHTLLFVYDGHVYSTTYTKDTKWMLHQNMWSTPHAHLTHVDTSESWMSSYIKAWSSSKSIKNITTVPQAQDIPAVAQLFAKLLISSPSVPIQDVTTTTRINYDTVKQPDNMQCVHLTFDAQSFVDALQEVSPSSQLDNLNALRHYHRTGKEPNTTS